MSIIIQGAAERVMEAEASPCLNGSFPIWLLRDGRRSLRSLRRRLFCAVAEAKKAGCCENREMIFQNSLGAWQLQTWDRGISQRSREFCGQKTLTRPLPKGE